VQICTLCPGVVWIGLAKMNKRQKRLVIIVAVTVFFIGLNWSSGYTMDLEELVGSMLVVLVPAALFYWVMAEKK